MNKDKKDNKYYYNVHIVNQLWDIYVVDTYMGIVT